MALAINERAAQIMEHLVTCKSHGYSQVSRLGFGGKETIKLSDGSQVKIMKGDRDCSSAIIDAYRSAGLPLKGATYTGNMRKAFLDTGMFKWHPGTSYSAKRGDIYLNELFHTAMCVSPYGSAKGDLLAEFSISEKGTVDGVEGDQTGHESHIRGYYNYPWDGILEYVGKPTPKVNISYALKVAGGSWLSTVTNYNNSNANGFAGYPCHKHNAFRARASKGTIKYRVHKTGGKWSGWYKDGQTASVSGSIDAIQAIYYTPSGMAKQHVHFRSQTTARAGWLDWCADNAKNKHDRYCGLYGEPLDRLQMYIK